MLGIGLNYIRFAVEEPNLFRFLFQSGYVLRNSLPEMINSEELIPIISVMQEVTSSVTFGIGHLLNLFNGSSMDLVNNLCQIFFAIAVGFLLVTIFYRSGSLIPCIMTHSASNMLNTFANEEGVTVEKQMIHVCVLILITVAYTVILTKTLPKKQRAEGDDTLSCS